MTETAQMDKQAAMFLVPMSELEATRTHFQDTLGFEEQFSVTQDDGSGMALFSYGPSLFYVATRGFAGMLPDVETRGALTLINVPHVEDLQKLISHRAPEVTSHIMEVPAAGMEKTQIEGQLTQTSDAERTMSLCFDVTDPQGNIMRFISLTDAKA